MTIELTDDLKIKLLNSDDVFFVMQKILLRESIIDQEKEHFWMIGMAGNNSIIFVELVSLGSVNATLVEPMNVYRVPVMKGAVKVIMVHNHPSGELNPSEEDIDNTDRLIQVGRILNIEAVDHLIISTETYASFSVMGLMTKLRNSLKWVPKYEVIERIRAEEKRIRDEMLHTAKKDKEKAVKKAKAEIAKQMLAENEPIEKIIKYTGLTKVEINKLKS